MKPYWEREGVAVYLGDNREMLPTFRDAEFDLVLTDPPYGIGVDGQHFSTSSHGGRKPYEFRGWDSRPDGWLFPHILRVGREAIIWGGNYFPEFLRPSMGWLVWDKGQEICSSDCELAFTTFDKALRRLILNRVALQKDGTFHPTQKPVRLMDWCIDYAGDVKTILDPYGGSMTTGVAAWRRGLRCVLIESDEGYCKQGVDRLDREMDQGRLFREESPRESQRPLFEAADA